MEGDVLFLGLRAVDVLTIAAIVIGPLLAVAVTRWRDNRQGRVDRKFGLFSRLMQTRADRLHSDHVGALNLIELEFYGNEQVLTPFRQYIAHLSAPMPAPDEQERFFAARHDLFVDLLHALGKALGYSFDKHDLARFSYYPSGWGNDNARMRHNAALLTDVLEGRRPLPIAPLTVPAQSPFPPPPELEDRGAP